jgi:zinc and cadmium transporter
MENEMLQLVLLVALGSIAGLIGGVIFLINDKWARVLCKYAVPFAAGVLISVSLLHLIPEAVHATGESVYVVVLASFIFAFFFEQFFAHLHHHEDKKHTMTKSSVPLVIFGDTIHNFIDGVAIAAAYLVNPMAGLVVAIATFLHEAPHEIADFGILVKSGWPKRKAFTANFLSAMATFPGAFLVIYYSEVIHGGVGVLLAISGGVFLYLGASDFLPEVAEENHGKPAWKELSVFILGVLLMYLLTFLTPEHAH